jgi:transcriptional regulator with XRE-family HTH domain
MNFPNRLAALIDRRALTQRTIAMECGISPGALTQYLQGRTPKAEELYRLAKFFNVTMEFLLTGAEDQDSVVRETPQPQSGLSVEIWRDRAKAAEAKVELLKSGMEGLLKKI